MRIAILAFLLVSCTACLSRQTFPDEGKDRRWTPILEAIESTKVGLRPAINIMTPGRERSVGIFSDKAGEFTFVALCYPRDREATKRAFEFFTELGGDYEEIVGQGRPCNWRGTGVNPFIGKIGKNPRWATQLTLRVFREVYGVPDSVDLKVLYH
jgi:hypothetical protein